MTARLSPGGGGDAGRTRQDRAAARSAVRPQPLLIDSNSLYQDLGMHPSAQKQGREGAGIPVGWSSPPKGRARAGVA
jgi:hypothetical protein